MTDTPLPPRPVPRWLHWWAVATVVVALALLVLGQMVTSFRAGMADPIWPTEPWYLLDNYKDGFGYLIEHTHRILGFAVGGFVGVLALGLVATDPRRAARWISVVAVVVLLGAFGEFHRALIAQREPGVPIVLPVSIVAVMLAALAGLLVLAGSGLTARGGVARLLGLVALVFVMIQGLLGGFRVKLNELVGTDLAAVHGVFGQVTFAVLVAVAVLTAVPPVEALAEADRRRMRSRAVGLLGALFVQLMLGAWVRHAPTPLAQRLHLLVAFVVVAKVVVLLRAVSAARPRVGPWGWALGLFVTVQVALGVEAWMGKFGDEARRGTAVALPEAREVSEKQAALRTAHALVGTGVLAAAVGFGLRLGSRAGRAGDTG